MKKLAFILLVTFVLLVTGCSSNILDTSDIFSPEDFQTNYDEDKSTFIQLNIDTAFSDSKTVKISGNTITITDKGDGIAASSKLLIDDGTFKIVNDGENTSSAADEDDNNGSTSRKGIKSSGSIVINGVFFGSGSSRMPQVFSESKQGFISLKVDTQLAGTKVSLTDIKENKLISSTEPAFDFDFLILSTPFIVKGETYNVTVGSYTTQITAN